MYLSLFIAKRYLLAKKSHNVINITSIISACGIAIGTMALIIILSVTNGFQGLVKDLYGTYEADLLISPSAGKSFSPSGEVFETIRRDGRVGSYCEVVEENVFVRYADQESIATIKGVDSAFASITGLNEHIVDGAFSLYHGEIPEAVLGRMLAYNLGLRIHFIDPLYLYFPSRFGNISVINPAASLNSEKVYASGVFAVEQGYDSRYIFVPLEVARNLLEYDNDVTSIELYFKDKSDIGPAKRYFSKLLGTEYVVKDRYEQNETLYKMMKSEKFTTYLILFFVLIIITCNLFGSLSLLVIEKRDDVETLRSMGAGERLVKNIFVLEGWLISLSGIAAGTTLALLFCFVQQIFGIIPMPGNFIIKNYPVVVSLVDIVITVCSIAVLGLIIASAPVMIEKKSKIFYK